MKCPSCKYEHRPAYGGKKKEIIGKKGEFFFLPKKRFIRDLYGGTHETREKGHAFACPSCGVVFIDTVNEQP